MPGQKVLLPYNFTVYDERALDFVIRILSSSKDAEITLFNAYTPAPEIDLNGSPLCNSFLRSFCLSPLTCLPVSSEK